MTLRSFIDPLPFFPRPSERGDPPSNTVPLDNAANDTLGISRVVTGALLAVVSGFTVFGGIHRIAKAADIVVPVMAIGYILMNIGSVSGVLASIVSNAFGFEEAVGGGMGAAIADLLQSWSQG